MAKKKSAANKAQRPARKPTTKSRSTGLVPVPKSVAPATGDLPIGYAPLLADLKARVRAAQLKAAVAVNRELMLLYWHIGREILRCQQEQGWGAKVVDRLSHDLRAEFPEMSGLSRSNLLYMRAFAETYPSEQLVQQLVQGSRWSRQGGHDTRLR